jgi:hypothetical protein
MLGAAVLVLHVAGGALPAPPLGRPSQWSAWTTARDPVVVAFGVVRLLALAAAWYGLVVGVAGVVLRLVSARHLASLVDRLTVVPLRRLVVTTVAVGISTAPLAAGAAGASTAAGPAPGAPPATVTMHLLTPASDNTAPTSQPRAGPSSEVSHPPRPDPPAAGAVTAAATWTVQPGQCFWSIAEAELGRVWGRRPTAAEVVPYWNRLIEANRTALADPGNADLVFPGQVFALPEL